MSGERHVEIPWATRSAGRILLVVAAVLCVVTAALGSAVEALGSGAILAVPLIWIGAACLFNQARLDLRADGRLQLRHGPIPLLRSVTVERAAVERVATTGVRGASGALRVELVMRDGRRHALGVGGMRPGDAERAARDVRELVAG